MEQRLLRKCQFIVQSIGAETGRQPQQSSCCQEGKRGQGVSSGSERRVAQPGGWGAGCHLGPCVFALAACVRLRPGLCIHHADVSGSAHRSSGMLVGWAQSEPHVNPLASVCSPVSPQSTGRCCVTCDWHRFPQRAYTGALNGVGWRRSVRLPLSPAVSHTENEKLEFSCLLSLNL